MYYPDLTPYQYWKEAGQPIINDVAQALNVGWLDDMYGYSKGSVPVDFVARLWDFCRTPVNLMLGFHDCPFCDADPRTYLVVEHGGQKIGMGSGEIWIFGRNGQTYAAPTLILHYITQHHYNPPQEFIQATLDSPLPDTTEYDERAAQFGWGQRMLRGKKFQRQ